ncbi:hypothetical protein L2W58_03555 [Dethiosulfovibrio sp. F2B]|uniref:hypothetical protein n=1 Tax=Dethiosulfovibrio faecalis TaxID=2720018 RepID=UPI001F2B9064|nr:hypothetical protein [Dethiosulfovibrio faecalis]MCF4150867.1 hypothetical protein [Dethiosulfovibrio faecalis]
MNIPMVPLGLQSVCGGDLNKQFQSVIPSLIDAITGEEAGGKKASVSITVTFTPIKDTNSMFTTTFKMVPKYPGTAKSSLCQMVDGELKTDAPTEQLTFIKDKEDEIDGQQRIV